MDSDPYIKVVTRDARHAVRTRNTTDVANVQTNRVHAGKDRGALAGAGVGDHAGKASEALVPRGQQHFTWGTSKCCCRAQGARPTYFPREVCRRWSSLLRASGLSEPPADRAVTVRIQHVHDAGVCLLDEYEGHPSFWTLVDDGYAVITSDRVGHGRLRTLP